MSSGNRGGHISVTVILALIAACTDATPADDKASAGVCAVLRDHLVELRLSSMPADIDAHRAALKQSLGDSFIDGCQQHISAGDVECAVSATTLTDAAGCTTDVDR